MTWTVTQQTRKPQNSGLTGARNTTLLSIGVVDLVKDPPRVGIFSKIHYRLPASQAAAEY